MHSTVIVSQTPLSLSPYPLTLSQYPLYPWFDPAFAAAAAVPPPWFVPAIAAATAAALPPILTAALAPLKAILNQMDDNLTELSMCYCKDLNSFRQMPHVGPFHEVLLPDG
ncbi:hypothetical protein BT96DRAFT_984368 [Gymnopus androsaceus JB14]|uniref:Uncharacterized protein n=1 Tax=Gymnopus androsaceus JB14 TaxID=1447944 RepID=A0A6A4IHB1_9AGAR|nr:hypothetical protein BT96DRAFT_984368 [Gymnopus androsaceus JB14]